MQFLHEYVIFFSFMHGIIPNATAIFDKYIPCNDNVETWNLLELTGVKWRYKTLKWRWECDGKDMENIVTKRHTYPNYDQLIVVSYATFQSSSLSHEFSQNSYWYLFDRTQQSSCTANPIEVQPKHLKSSRNVFRVYNIDSKLFVVDPVSMHRDCENKMIKEKFNDNELNQVTQTENNLITSLR